MTPGARLAAACEVLDEVLARKAAADRVLQKWGKAHRFAGSKDRAGIGERVYAVLRRMGECAAVFDSEQPRALVIASLRVIDRLPVDEIERLCADGAHAPGALTPAERSKLSGFTLPDRPQLALNCPPWLRGELEAAFGDTLEAELEALNGRAPLDLRVNLLKATRPAMLEELTALGLKVSPCPRAEAGIRFAPGSNAKIESLGVYEHGCIEVQDESSQLAVAFAGALPGDTVVDLAAGGGGKSLALAAAMGNRGRILACDVDLSRLANLGPRLMRAGASIIKPSGDPYADGLQALLPEGADLVFVDAPCSGSGTWRRNPEAKWTLSPDILKRYGEAQTRLLERASQIAKPSGRIVYAVCSMLPSEGNQRVRSFCEASGKWTVSRDMFLTPLRFGTDGFFAAELRRRTL